MYTQAYLQIVNKQFMKYFVQWCIQPFGADGGGRRSNHMYTDRNKFSNQQETQIEIVYISASERIFFSSSRIYTHITKITFLQRLGGASIFVGIINCDILLIHL